MTSTSRFGAELPFAVAFEADLPLGRCLGLALDAGQSTAVEHALGLLPEQERALAARFGARRRATFVGGRHALRAVLADPRLSSRAVPTCILWNDRGAPALPPSVRASISHKDDLAVAFVASPGEGAAGVDLESRSPRASDVAPHVLTGAERARLGSVPSVSAEEEVLLRFSAKEALYKVLDPYLRRFIGFQEVEVDPRGDGACDVTLLLKEGEPPRHIELRWTSSEALGLSSAPFFLTTAVSRR